MNDANDARLLRDYIAGNLDEDRALQFEERLMSDDAFADSLDLGETELLEAWVNGELDPGLAEQVADLVAASPRLRARADTAFGLAHRSGQPAAPARMETGVGDPPSRTWTGPLLVLVIVVAVVLAALLVRSSAERRALAARADQFESELEELRAEDIELRRELARLRAAERVREPQ